MQAIIEAGHKRARPIVMTTVAMVAGMLPVALGFGGDTAFREPMAIAVIGGLITSTGLTLVIVPAAFSVIDDIERWLGPKFGRVLMAQPPTARRPHSRIRRRKVLLSAVSSDTGPDSLQRPPSGASCLVGAAGLAHP